MKKFTEASAAALIGVTVLSSTAQEHKDPESESTEQRDHYSLSEGRSESDNHYSSEKWLDPPAEYADKVSNVWTDTDAIARGEKIWVKNCMTCHGAEGHGAGLLAESLSHLPADLSDNFHTAPGDGDAYLYWRLSEGGAIQPFTSMGSSMPAFKDMLSERERWDVLAYVHVFFHQGLIHWKLPEKLEGGTSAKDDGG